MANMKRIGCGYYRNGIPYQQNTTQKNGVWRGYGSVSSNKHNCSLYSEFIKGHARVFRKKYLDVCYARYTNDSSGALIENESLDVSRFKQDIMNSGILCDSMGKVKDWQLFYDVQDISRNLYIASSMQDILQRLPAEDLEAFTVFVDKQLI